MNIRWTGEFRQTVKRGPRTGGSISVKGRREFQTTRNTGVRMVNSLLLTLHMLQIEKTSFLLTNETCRGITPLLYRSWYTISVSGFPPLVSAFLDGSVRCNQTNKVLSSSEDKINSVKCDPRETMWSDQKWDCQCWVRTHMTYTHAP